MLSAPNYLGHCWAGCDFERLNGRMDAFTKVYTTITSSTVCQVGLVRGHPSGQVPKLMDVDVAGKPRCKSGTAPF